MHYWLGRAYEDSGWTDRARDEYAELIDVWANADNDIEVLADARNRLSALETYLVQTKLR